MIIGYFSIERGRLRPFIDAVFQFPTLNSQRLQVPLLVDTGADRTILSPSDALRLSRRSATNLSELPQSAPSIGVGGQVLGQGFVEGPTRTAVETFLDAMARDFKLPAALIQQRIAASIAAFGNS